MHFLATYRLRWYRRAFNRKGASSKCRVEKCVANSFARWRYNCWILRWRHFSCFDKKKQVYL